MKNSVVSLLYFIVGMAPITALCFTIFGLWTLPVGTILLVLPLISLGLYLAVKYPLNGKEALHGFLIGIIAVFFYDCVRYPFILAGLWGDFIPKIGGWLLGNSEPNWIAGYLWRYI